MKHLRLLLLTCVTPLVILAVGCAPFAPEKRDTLSAALPAHYSLYSPLGEAPGQWWEQFNSAQLNMLVDKALSRGFTLRQYWAQLEQSRALARQAGAALTPSLNATGDTGHTRSWTETPSSGADSLTLSDSYGLGLAASYELDLWGRLRATAQSGLLDAQASREDLNTAAITVAGEVSEAWLDLLATREQVRLVRNQVATNEQILSVQQLLFAASQASALDILQQQQTLAATKALLPPLKTQERTTLNELAILTGQMPGSLQLPQSSALPDLPTPPKTGFPADLLASRPDIRSAGLALESADWQIATARADRLPDLTLSASADYGGNTLENLFDAWSLNLASSLVFPLLDGGTRAAEVDRTRALAQERLAAYEETVFTAIQEVEDALVTESGQQDYLLALGKQLTAARLAKEEAHRRYLNGVDDYLSMLNALTTVQTLERTLIQEKTDLLKNRITLYRALGTDWADKLTPTGLILTNITRKHS
ncbi:efflux transporter outer membrane subunit [Desulfovibrio ferrophilus]|uniref:RND efflux system, outer membrane lipoprotein, NodT family n=1 Tax=Desulfovibrio ferrophilus TaxID=241368 RepID=A0A2Z6AV63_9BACT|nr:TolC family protein [Desulfovibrio ferrophilus]BBD07108.1 RND efflux system, outer membrane lipoprotein, NodT family [Desulfovibrio ferrophilus]